MKSYLNLLKTVDLDKKSLRLMVTYYYKLMIQLVGTKTFILGSMLRTTKK